MVNKNTEEYNRLLKCVKTSNSLRETAEKFGCSETTVIRKLKLYEIEYKNLFNNKRNKIALTKEQILDAQKQTNSAAQAAKLLGVSSQTYARRANELGVYISNQGLKGSSKPRNSNIDTRKYSCNDDAFSILTPESAYWLGFLAADGSVSEERNKVCVVLQRSDKEHLENLKLFLDFTGPVIDRVRVLKGKEYPISELTIYSKKIVKDLVEKYHIRQNKTALDIDFLSYIPLNFIKYFVIGFFDGDGCIRNTDAGAFTYTVNQYNVKSFISIFKNQFDIVLHSYKTRNVYNLTACKNEDKKKFYSLYLDVATKCSVLNRKLEKVKYYNTLI